MSIITFFKNLFNQQWFKDLIKTITSILVKTLQEVGRENIDKIKVKIIETNKMDATNKEKFSLVFSYIKLILPTLKDSAINRLIENLIGVLKEDKVI